MFIYHRREYILFKVTSDRGYPTLPYSLLTGKFLFFIFTARITAVVLPAADYLKFRGPSAIIVYSRHFEKKNYKYIVYTL